MTAADDAPGQQDAFALLRLLADNVPVAVAYYDAATFVCRLANRGYAQMFGFGERSVAGLTFAQIIGEAAARAIDAAVQRMLATRERASYEREITAPDGSSTFIDVHLLPHVEASGQLVGAFVLIADITRHRRAELALRRSEERLAKFMEASAEGIVFHRAGVIVDVNPPLLRLLGHALEEMMGRQILEFVAPQERDRAVTVMASGAEITYESQVLHKDGQAIPVEFIVRTMRFGDENLRMAIVRDRRDRLAAEAHIRHLAHHDSLTGLPNRIAFDERVAHLIALAEQGAPGIALMFIDLDHFKRVNDSLGHMVGDAFLRTVAGRIAGALRGGDLVARFGGDEFIVVVTGGPTREAVLDIAAKLLAVIGATVEVQGSQISVTPSIGVALYPQDGRSPAALIKHADIAMYQAKTRGRAHCRFFEAHMAEAAYADLTMEGRLAQAIRGREFVLHFQPQIALDSGALVGVEALIRWQQPERGLVMPEEFLPVAEARRLMLPIGQWVLDEALYWAGRWRGAGLLAAPMAVNLSTVQFQSAGFVASVRDALARRGARGEALELEITERMLMDDVHAARDALDGVRALGVRVAIDDFGTGYTSLGHLKDLPIDRLKIDRTFVQGLPDDRGSAAIARAIIQLAAHLGMSAVAEGVETPAQCAWVAAHGCSEVQGHLTGRPLPAADFEAWLRARPTSV